MRFRFTASRCEREGRRGGDGGGRRDGGGGGGRGRRRNRGGGGDGGCRRGCECECRRRGFGGRWHQNGPAATPEGQVDERYHQAYSHQQDNDDNHIHPRSEDTRPLRLLTLQGRLPVHNLSISLGTKEVFDIKPFRRPGMQ